MSLPKTVTEAKKLLPLLDTEEDKILAVQRRGRVLVVMTPVATFTIDEQQQVDMQVR